MQIKDRQKTDRRSTEILLLVLAALAALLLLLALNSARATPAQIDEFIVLSSAKVIYQGALPYRDYFNFIPPISHAIYAALFAISGGPNAGAARLLTDLIIVLSALLAYGLLRRFGLRPWRASLPPLILISLFFAIWPIPLHHWWGLFFSLASLAFMAAALGKNQPTAPRKNPARPKSNLRTTVYVLMSGLLLGLSGLTVQTHGFINLAALLALLLASRQNLLAPKNPSVNKGAQNYLLRTVLLLGLGATISLTIFVLYLLVTHTLTSFFNESILFVFFQYKSGHNHNSMGFLSDVGPRLHTLMSLKAPTWIRLSLISGSLALLAAVALAALTSFILFFRQLLAKQWRCALAISLPWLAATVAMMGRPDLFHLAFYALIPILSSSLLLQRLGAVNLEHLRFSQAYHSLLTICLVIGFWAHLLLPWLQGATIPGFFAQSENSDAVFAGLPAVDAALVQNNGLYELVRAYALKHPDARLFASINGIPAYFLAMAPACRETVVYPPRNSFSGARQYQRVLDDFRRRPPELLLFVPQKADATYLDPKQAPNAPSRAWVDFVKTHYHFAISNGLGRVYLLNGAADL